MVVHDDARRYQRHLEALLGAPTAVGNRVDVLRNGDEIFPAMLEAIRAAERTVDLLTFIYWDGAIGRTFADALAERASGGVRVRVLLDALGARKMNRAWVSRMEAAGVRVEWFRPMTDPRVWRWNHRTHRKVLVCDETVAFTGGVGIADEWAGDARHAGEWRDTHFRVTGPAVEGLRAAFTGNWAETGQPDWDAGVDTFPIQAAVGDVDLLTVRGQAQAGWSDITTVVRTLLRLAERRVRMATAYFSPDPTTLRLMQQTAERGVEVQVLLPGPHADKRFVQVAGEDVYRPLLDSGVAIANFQPSMLHAKITLVDDVVACIGSANLNARTFAHDEEIVLVAFDAALAGVLDGHFVEDWARSEAIDLDRWRRRNPLQRGVEQIASAVSWFI
ncbi:MAG: phospholipase D-like domain-containing protein [Egibacteraceae bacterium]